MAAEVLMPRAPGTSDDDESIGAFVRRRFGQEAADYLADPLLAGIHAGDVDALSVRTLFPRLVEAERQSGSVLRAFRAMKMTRSPQGAFVSLPGGIGELVEALVAAALAPGTVRLLGPRSPRFDRAGELHRGLRRAGRVRCRAVLLCVPAYVAGGLLRALDTAAGGACDAIPYASTATVAFGYRRDQVAHPMQGTGFVVPRAERRALLAGTWVTSKWPGRAPDGHVLLRAFLGGGRDPQSARSARRRRARPRLATRSSASCSASPASPLLHPPLALAPAEPAVRRRPPARVCGRSSSASTRSGAVPRRQRLPRHRHSRLHRRRPCHRHHACHEWLSAVTGPASGSRLPA